MKVILCTLLGSMLIGCTAFSEQARYAQKNDWHDVGVADGKSGHYQRSEIELNELNDVNAMAYEQYRNGYGVGIDKFCQPEKTYEQGMRGISYKGQCISTSQEDTAIEKWQEGYESYLIEITAVYIDEYSDFF